MKILLSSLFATVALSMAFQDALTSLKLSSQFFQSAVTDYVTREMSGADRTIALPFIGSNARPLFLAMNDATRAGVVKELGLAAKNVIMTPAFLTTYNSRIKVEKNAVDHGLKVVDTSAAVNDIGKSNNNNMDDAEKKMQAMFRDQFRELALSQVKEVNTYNGEIVTMMAEATLAQMDSIPPMNAAEKAMHAKATAQLKEAIKLSASNLPTARERLRTGRLLSVYVEASGAGNAELDQAKKEQQISYDKRALRPNLKRQLLAFVAEARSVDFKAATQPKAGKTVFVNSAIERKSRLWKMLYRLGPGGTASAISVALSWAAEL